MLQNFSQVKFLDKAFAKVAKDQKGDRLKKRKSQDHIKLGV